MIQDQWDQIESMISLWSYHYISQIKCTPTGFQQQYAIVEHLRYFFITCNWWLFFVGTSYIDIPHNIGYYPDYVIVQLKLPDNYISEAQGSITRFRTLSIPSIMIHCRCMTEILPKRRKTSYNPSIFIMIQNHQILFLGTLFKTVAWNSHNEVCGVIMAYDSTNIRLWPSHKGPGFGECK